MMDSPQITYNSVVAHGAYILLIHTSHFDFFRDIAHHFPDCSASSGKQLQLHIHALRF
jgi:hypothetical protein